MWLNEKSFILELIQIRINSNKNILEFELIGKVNLEYFRIRLNCN